MRHFRPFFELLQSRPEVAGEVILSCVVLDCVGVDFLVKRGDFRFNIGRIIWLFGQPDPFYALFAEFNCILQPTDVASDVFSGAFMGLIVPEKRVKFRDGRLNLSYEIPPETVVGGIFDVFSR